MKLNMHILHHELSEIVVGSNLTPDYSRPTLEYPILLNPNDRGYVDEVVYVTIDKHLEELQNFFRYALGHNQDRVFSCICIGEPPAFYRNASNCNIIWIDPQIARTRLFNDVQKIFQYYNSWENQLEQITQNGGSILDLVDASVKVIKNDICVTDQFSKVIAHRTYKNRRFPKEQTDLIKTGEYLPRSMIFDGVEEELCGEDFNSFDPIYAEMKAFECTVLRSSISSMMGYVVFLSIHPNFQEIGEKDRPATLILANSIERLYSTYDIFLDNENYINARSTFKSYLQGKLKSDSDLVRCMTSLGWDYENDEYLCFCMDFIPTKRIPDNYFMRPFISVSDHIQKRLGSLSFIIDSRIIAIANKTQLRQNEEQILSQFEQFAQEYDLVMGVSALYQGCQMLPGSYLQAFAALRKGYGLTESQHLVRFESNALDIGMSLILKKMNPEFFCPQELITLAITEPDLYAALETYLRANCNSSVASKKLYLQRNSFIYRLEKTKKLLSLDLDDPDARLWLLVSFKLLELYGIESLKVKMSGESHLGTA